MINKKLTAGQIQKLYDFTATHFVEWYDLQTELVDHLANGIEEKWQENPELSFDDILNLEFKKFGVFGFEDVVTQKKVALTKKYDAIVLRELKKLFISPKVFIIIILTFSLYFSYIQFARPNEPIAVLFLIIALYAYYQFFKAKQSMKIEEGETSKKWIYNEVTLNRIQVLTVTIANLLLSLCNLFKEYLASEYLILGICFLQVVLLSVVYLTENKIINEFERSEKQFYTI